MSFWKGKGFDWLRKTDHEVLADIQQKLTERGLDREEHETLPVGLGRGQLHNQQEKFRELFIDMSRAIRMRIGEERTFKQLQAECSALGLCIEWPSAIALKWLFERMHTEPAIEMAVFLKQDGGKAEVKVELHDERTLEHPDHHGARCGEVERYYKHTLWVTDPEDDAEPLEVWHWFRSIAAGDYNYRDGQRAWSAMSDPGWWNWENTPPTNKFEGYEGKEQELCEALEAFGEWPPETIKRPAAGENTNGNGKGPYR